MTVKKQNTSVSENMRDDNMRIHVGFVVDEISQASDFL